MILHLDSEFSQLNTFIHEKSPSKVFFLVDENTHEFCLPLVLPHIASEARIEILEIESGEEMKTIDTAIQLWEILAEFGADRKSLLINLGGGVITDLGGFVASTYKRGIPFVHIPTTLLGMVDASIGGKTGIDHGFLKNLVGTFAVPEAIFLYPNFLKTLEFGELRSGFAEMLKHALIADSEHWELLKNIRISPEEVRPFIETSMKIKQNIVEQDFREEHLRKTLNFGHTVGHAIESAFLTRELPIRHGEAVAAGMLCEMYIAVEDGILNEMQAKIVEKSILSHFPLLDLRRIDTKLLINFMRNDKKNESENIRFSLISSIGTAVISHETSLETIAKSLDYYKALGNRYDAKQST